MLSFQRKEQIASVPYRRRDYLMGTLIQQQLYGINAEAAAMEAFAEIFRLERLWSVYIPDSEVNKLSGYTGIHPVTVHPDTGVVLSLAKRFLTITNGAFNVTIAPLMDEWRTSARQCRLPSQDRIKSLLRLVDAGDIEIGAGPTAFLKNKAQSVDLGGIGKGYAADRCGGIYRRNGIFHAMLNIGGNVMILGRKPDGMPWCVGIQDPDGERGKYVGFIETEDCSVVTSGNYERFFEVDEKKYSHIISPLTGRPIPFDMMSVTIVSSSSVRADALATACMVLGVDRSKSLIDGLEDAEMLVLDKSGSMSITEGLEKRFIKIDS